MLWVRRAPALDPDDLGLEGPGSGVLEHEDAPVHRQVLDEDVHDVVEQLVEGHMVDEGLADLAEDGDDPLVLLEALQVEARRRGSSVAAARRRLLEKVLDLDDRVRAWEKGVPSTGSTRAGRSRSKKKRVEPMRISSPRAEIDLRRDPAAVDERPVLAALVDEGEAPLGRGDDGVAGQS